MNVFFFFKQKTAYEMRISDWSSDVCSSDLSWSTAVRQPSSSTSEADAKASLTAPGSRMERRCHIWSARTLTVTAMVGQLSKNAADEAAHCSARSNPSGRCAGSSSALADVTRLTRNVRTDRVRPDRAPRYQTPALSTSPRDRTSRLDRQSTRLNSSH